MQRAIEKWEIPTVSLTVALDVSFHIKPPRAMFLPFMMGDHFGVPFHKNMQREIISKALRRLENATESGDIFHFQKTWAQARREGKTIEAEIKKIGIKFYEQSAKSRASAGESGF